ncbi:MAG: hypothetical protein ACR2JF_14070 [Iamia sp.]
MSQPEMQRAALASARDQREGHRLAAGVVDGDLDPDATCSQVDPVPAQTGQLAASHSGDSPEVAQDPEVGLLGERGLEEEA